MAQSRSVSLAHSALSHLSITNTESSLPASSTSETTPDHDEIIDNLEIDRKLVPGAGIDQSKASIFLAFDRFHAIKLAHNRLNDKSITWTKKPSERLIIQLFISTSQFYNTWVSAFKPVLDLYPDMMLWLQRKPDAPDAEALWGRKQDSYTIKDLIGWCKEQKEEKEDQEKKAQKEVKSTAKKSKKKAGSALQK